MADRTTKVTLTAQVSNYVAGMQKAQAATKATGSEAQKLGQQKAALQGVGVALLGLGTVAAVGVGLAIKSFADFDAKMSQIQTLSHATADEMHGLSEAALTLGQNIGFSATEVADAETELVKAGVSVKDILGGALKGSLELAAAGQIDVAQATSIASSAMVQFGLAGKDVSHISDLLAAGADKALGGVDDLGTALKYAGPVAASLGISLESTVGVLAEFAQNGILADQAGTSLRGVLSSLTSPSAQAADVMKKYGITLFDAQGKFIGLAGAAGQLHDKLGPLTQAERANALGHIFGNQQLTAANVLLKDGAAGVDKWTKAVNDQGFASQQARGKMDNLNGDIKKLSAAFETGLIRSGSAANGVLRQVVQTITALARGFSNLGGPAQATILITGAIVAGLALLGGAFLTIVPKVAAFKLAMDTLGTSIRSIGLAGGVVGIAITGLVTILAAVAGSQQEAQARTDEFTQSLDENTGAITKNTRAVAAKQLHDNGAIETANKLGVSLSLITDASLGNATAIDKVKSQWDNWRTTAKGSSAELTQNGILWQNLLGNIGATSSSLKDAKRDFKNTQDAMADSSKGADSATTGIGNISAAADDASAALDSLNKQLLGLGQANLDASASTIKFQQSIADATAAIQKNGASLDLSTQAGRDNQSALDNIASSAISLVAAQQKAGSSAAALTGTMQSARDQFINAAVAAGRSRAEAAKLADQYGLIPKNVATAFQTSGADAAISKAAEIQAAYNAITKDYTINVRTVTTGNPGVAGNLYKNADGGMYSFAGGGMAPGIFAGGTPMYKFAEPETRWEAFISGKPGQESRNRQVWVDAGRRLGMDPGSASAPRFNITVQSKGGVDLLKYVDVRVDQIDRAKARKFGQG